jgi:hypothetical protein
MTFVCKGTERNLTVPRGDSTSAPFFCLRLSNCVGEQQIIRPWLTALLDLQTSTLATLKLSSCKHKGQIH